MIFILLFYLSFLSIPQPKPVFHHYKFVKTLSLGQGKPDSREYLIGHPVNICTDSHGRIYLNDSMFPGIRVFDRDGNYLTTIGRHGRGPAEFTEQSDMTITPNDQLVVLDRYRIRATVFDVSSSSVSQLGKKFQTFDFPSKKVVTPIQTLGFKDGSFVVAYRHYYPPGDKQPNQIKTILNFISPDFKKITGRALPLKDLGDMSDPFIQAELGGVLSLNMAIMNQQELIVSPYFYQGRLYVVQKANGQWQVSKTIHGYVQTKDAVEYYPNASSAPPYAQKISSYGKRYAGVLNNESAGLFPTPNGGFIHFSYIQYKGKRQYFLEKFTARGELLEYGPIVNLSNTEKKYRLEPFQLVWKDQDNQFYFKDYRTYKTTGDKVGRGYIKVVK